MRYTYPIVIHDDQDGFWGEFPDLDGCLTDGESINELMENAQEALEGFLLSSLEHGIKFNQPSDCRNLALEPSTFAALISIDVDLAKNTKSVKKTLTIPAWLNDRAAALNINFSQTLQEALLAKLP